MEKETTRSPNLAEIWGDTVDLKHLAGAMAIGIVFGFVFYRGGLYIIETQLTQLPANLYKSIALLVGIVGCLLAAVVSAKLFPPKRIMSEQHFSDEDRARVLKELQVDLEQEAEEMKRMPASVIREMEELKLADVFRKPNGTKGD